MNLNPAYDLVKLSEGLRLHSYQDGIGKWTIGYGTTKIDGHAVVPGMFCTESQAIKWMQEDVSKCVSTIQSMVKVPLTDNQMCALVSLAYNIGTGGLYRSTLLHLLNNHAPKVEVAEQFKRFIYAGGHIEKGLVIRRQAEHDLFLA